MSVKKKKIWRCRICRILTKPGTCFCTPEHKKEYWKRWSKSYYIVNQKKIKKTALEWQRKNKDKFLKTNRKAAKKYQSKIRVLKNEAKSSEQLDIRNPN